MKIPTKAQIEIASHYRICEWWRFCTSPMGKDEREAMNLMAKKMKEYGGFTSEISKQLGWNPR